jgi:uncharacterized membrane-anchored protein
MSDFHSVKVDNNFVNKLPQITAAFWLMKITATTLGETGGDWLSMTMNLGYTVGASILVTILIGLLALWKLTVGNVSVDAIHTRKAELFWIAFILTRPFGATFGDVLTKSQYKGGLDFGRGYSSLILLSILIVTILFVYKKPGRKDSGLAHLII